MKKAISRDKAVNKPRPNKALVASPRAGQRGAGKKPGGLWPALNAGLAATGDAAAATVSLLELLASEGAENGLCEPLAHALGVQFARATAAARKRAAKPLDAASIAAATALLDTLKIYTAAAVVIGSRAGQLAATHGALAKPDQKKFQSGLGKLALAVTREHNIADVPALMAAALDGLINDAPVPKKKGRAKA
jgi:hypothetical protein